VRHDQLPQIEVDTLLVRQRPSLCHLVGDNHHDLHEVDEHPLHCHELARGVLLQAYGASPELPRQGGGACQENLIYSEL
jgi:hypothetical protein